ncbi:unnamed protein product, partial [Closterium sp. NIES-53]
MSGMSSGVEWRKGPASPRVCPRDLVSENKTPRLAITISFVLFFPSVSGMSGGVEWRQGLASPRVSRPASPRFSPQLAAPLGSHFCVDVVGCVVVSAFGIFPLIKLDITNRMPAAGPTSEGHSGRPSGTPVKALLTSDLAHLIVVTASSSSREGKQLRQGEAGCELALFHTPMMRDSPWEVLAVATHGAALTGLMESVSAAAAAMHGQWEAASCQWREKVQALQRLLEEN